MIFRPEKVKERREELGFSQADLAKKARIPDHQVKNIEAGRVKKLEYQTALSLARALKVKPDYFFASADVEIHKQQAI